MHAFSHCIENTYRGILDESTDWTAPAWAPEVPLGQAALETMP
jgi:hypothetical protein